MLSVAAAIPTAAIERQLADGVPVVRAMPNTPSTVHEGIAGICAGAHAERRAPAPGRGGALRTSARSSRCPSATWTRSPPSPAPGPAYFALLAEAMIEAGILLGLSREISTKLVVQTMLGTAKLLRDEGMHPVELREMVTSPGGTTIRAIRELEQRRRARRVPERDPGRDGALAGARRRRRVTRRRRRARASVDDAEEAAPSSATSSPRPRARATTIVLTGGSTPGRAYELAAELEPDWSARRLWWGDERCVPPDDERSNYRLAREHAARPARAPPPRGAPDPRRARRRTRRPREYDERARRRRGSTCVLLGLGPDGHTASLFPGSPPLDERERRAIAGRAGLEPFVDRVTMTLPVLARRRSVLFLVTGEDKAEAVAAGVRRAARSGDAREPDPLGAGRTRVVARRGRRSRLPG